LPYGRKVKPTTVADMSPHTVQFVTAELGVKLDVLDWGVTGRPVVLLAGLVRSAHIFDKFAAQSEATAI
jgi:non-heme chloroperoxidase